MLSQCPNCHCMTKTIKKNCLNLCGKCKEDKGPICERCGVPYKHDTHTCYWYPCSGCPDGHPSFWKTIVESKYWELWEKENDRRMHLDPIGKCFDYDECRGCGIFGKEHFEEFINFIVEIKNGQKSKKGTERK